MERLQPQRVGALLDGGFDVLRFRFRTVMIVSAVWLVPLVAAPQAVSYRQLADAVDELGNVSGAGGAVNGGFGTTFGPFGAGSSPWSTLVLAVLPLLGIALVGLSLSHLVGGWLAGRDPGPMEVLRATVRQVPTLLVAFVLAIPLKALGLIACYIGAAVVIGQLQIMSPVIAFERLGPVAAIGRSWRLSSRRFWRGPGLVVGLAVVTNVVSFGLLGIVQIVVGVGTATGTSWVWIVGAALSFATSMVLLPVQASVAILHYIDLRVRSEGLDLQVRMPQVVRRELV